MNGNTDLLRLNQAPAIAQAKAISLGIPQSHNTEKPTPKAVFEESIAPQLSPKACQILEKIIAITEFVEQAADMAIQAQEFAGLDQAAQINGTASNAAQSGRMETFKHDHRRQYVEAAGQGRLALTTQRSEFQPSRLGNDFQEQRINIRPRLFSADEHSRQTSLFGLQVRELRTYSRYTPHGKPLQTDKALVQAIPEPNGNPQLKTTDETHTLEKTTREGTPVWELSVNNLNGQTLEDLLRKFHANMIEACSANFVRLPAELTL